MQEPEYVRTSEGIRFSDSQGSLGPPLQTGLALMYDRVEGVVLRHGEASAVDALYQQYIAALAGTALTSDIVMLGFDLAHLTSLLLSEVNRAIQTAGYLATNAQRLGAPAPGKEEPQG